MLRIERSGGIYTTENQAKTWKRNVEKGKLPPDRPTRKPRQPETDASTSLAATSPATLETFGDFVERWWPTWSVLRPGPGYVLYLLNSRIPPTFGARLLPRADHPRRTDRAAARRVRRGCCGATWSWTPPTTTARSPASAA